MQELRNVPTEYSTEYSQTTSPLVPSVSSFLDDGEVARSWTNNDRSWESSQVDDVSSIRPTSRCYTIPTLRVSSRALLSANFFFTLVARRNSLSPRCLLWQQREGTGREEAENGLRTSTVTTGGGNRVVRSIFRLVLVVKAVDNGSLLNGKGEWRKREKRKRVKRKVTCRIF